MPKPEYQIIVSFDQPILNNVVAREAEAEGKARTPKEGCR